MHITWQHILTYGLLTLALAVLWLPAKEIQAIPLRLWQLLCLAALACGLLFGYVQPIGLFPVTFFAAVCYCTGSARYSKPVRIIAGTIMLLFSVVLSQHLVPGFANPKCQAPYDNIPKRSWPLFRAWERISKILSEQEQPGLSS